MAETWYEVKNWNLAMEEITVGTVTDKSVMRLDVGRRQARVSEYSRVFPTREAAVAYRLQEAEIKQHRAIEVCREMDEIIKECSK